MELVYSLGSVFIVSFISLVGLLTISIEIVRLQKFIFFLVALAVGALFGDAFLHLIPEALEESSNVPITSLLVIVGILLFFSLETVFRWHHAHTHIHSPEGISNEMRQQSISSSVSKVKPIGRLVLFADGIHNFIDGIIIGVSYLVSIPVGIATTIAIIFHEIPQEIGDFGVLLHAGYTKSRALFYNFLSALIALLGAIIVALLGERIDLVLGYILPIAAGALIYLAGSDLVPELHRREGPKSIVVEFVMIIVGVAVMYSLLWFE